MRVFIGMILGAFLTIAGAFTYDTLSGRMDNIPPSAGEQRPMVNWDVVKNNWNSLEANLREMGSRVQEQWRKLTG
jgi:hypothetical protein